MQNAQGVETTSMRQLMGLDCSDAELAQRLRRIGEMPANERGTIEQITVSEAACRWLEGTSDGTRG